LSKMCNTIRFYGFPPLFKKPQPGGPFLGVLCSAPAPNPGGRADNRALSVTGFRDRLEALAQQ
ncbi:serine protease, partial [Enterobacter hormaechei]|nr:serine protease [Enterobacter hormaechei]